MIKNSILLAGLPILTLMAGFMLPAKAQSHHTVQLVPCLNCEASSFESAARTANTGIVYVYDSPEKGVRAFQVMRNDEPNNYFLHVEEVAKDIQVENALLSVLSMASGIEDIRSSTEFRTTEGFESVTSLAGRYSLQSQLSLDLNDEIQSSIANDISFLIRRTFHSNMISQAAGWNGPEGVTIKFPDGSYIELKFSDAIAFEDRVNIEFEVVRLVDSEGDVVPESRQEFYGWSTDGSESYIGHYRNMLSRLNFKIETACDAGRGTTKIECSTVDSCTVIYYKAAC